MNKMDITMLAHQIMQEVRVRRARVRRVRVRS